MKLSLLELQSEEPGASFKISRLIKQCALAGFAHDTSCKWHILCTSPSAWITDASVPCGLRLARRPLFTHSDAQRLPWRCCWIDSLSAQRPSSPAARRGDRKSLEKGKRCRNGTWLTGGSESRPLARTLESQGDENKQEISLIFPDIFLIFKDTSLTFLVLITGWKS